MAIQVTISAYKLLGNVDAAPALVQDAVSAMLDYWLGRVRTRAKRVHRFKSRTGNLVAAIQERMYYLSGKVYIDEKMAPYAKFVYRGHRTWAPDRFIHDAYDALKGRVQDSLAKTLEDGWNEYLDIQKE